MLAVLKTKDASEARETPNPGDPCGGHVVVSVAAAGICRTDLAAASGRIPVARGRILGHEFSGFVSAVGRGSGWREGDFVSAFPFLPCGSCACCRGGRPSACPRPQAYGLELDGCFAEKILLPGSLCSSAEGLDPFQAAYAEPVAASLAAARCGLDADVGRDARILVHGANRIAALTARCLRAEGWICVEEGTPELEEDGWDAIVETIPLDGGLSPFLRALRVGGTLVLKSRRRTPDALVVGEAVAKGIVLRGASYAPFSDALDLLRSGRLDVSDLLGPAFPLSAWGRAREAAEADDASKILLVPDGGPA